MNEPQAAVAILHASAPEEAVLLIRRAERKEDPWSGHWSLPGGKCEPGDRDALGTALRELAEECGIHLPREAAVATLDPRHALRRPGPGMLVAPFVFQLSGQVPATIDRDEAVEAYWLPLAALANPARHRLCVPPGMPAHCLFPAVPLQEAPPPPPAPRPAPPRPAPPPPLPAPPLWGFTYRLLLDWRGLTPSLARTEAATLAMLDFLLHSGLAPAQEWNGTEARVRGRIPVERMLAWLGESRPELPAVCRIEVRPESVCVTGSRFEEYWIRAATPASSA